MVQALEVSPKVGIHEAPQDQKDLVSVAKLAGTLDGAKFRNWDDVFRSDRLLYAHRVGDVTMRRLGDFRRKLLDHKQNLTRNSIHTVEISTYAKRKGYKRKVYIVDGIPVVFVNRDVNEEMELLLRGDEMAVDKESQIARDVRREVTFLNKYFGLAINVYQKPDDGGSQALHFRMQKELRLIVRETTMPVR